MKLAFMTSVAPQMTLAELISAAQGFGYAGIEFRPEWKQAHGVELTASAAARAEAKRRLQDAGIAGCCISPGVKFCHEDAAVREADAQKLEGYIELAAAVGIGHVRIFGDPIPNMGRAANYQQQAEYLAKGAKLAADAGVRLVMETHGTFRAFDMGEMLFRTAYPSALWVNWHLFHCLNHGEDIDEAYRHVKGRVAHVHFALDEKASEWPSLRRQYALLKMEGYAGYWSVEVINPPEAVPVLVRHKQAWERLLAQ